MTPNGSPETVALADNLWPRTLDDLPDQSPLRQEFLAYMDHREFEGSLQDAATQTVNADVQETARTLLHALHIAEKNTQPKDTYDQLIAGQADGSWEVHSATKPNLPAIVAAEHDTYDRPLDKETYIQYARKSISRGNVAFPPSQKKRRPLRALIARLAGEDESPYTNREDSVGHVLYDFLRSDRKAFLRSLALKKEVRGTGVAEALLARVLELLNRYRVQTIVDEVEPTHQRAIRTLNVLSKLLDCIAKGGDEEIQQKHVRHLQEGMAYFPDTPFCDEIKTMLRPALAETEVTTLTEEGKKSVSAVRATLSALSHCADQQKGKLSYSIDTNQSQESALAVEVCDGNVEFFAKLKHLVPALDKTAEDEQDEARQWIEATVDGCVVGLASYVKVPDGAFSLKHFHVAPSFLNNDRGIVSALSVELLKKLQLDTDCDRIWLPDSFYSEE